MIALILILVLIGIATGPLLAKVGSIALRRGLGWMVVIMTVVAADFVVNDVAPLWRMAAICFVLLGGMKGLVYAEWAGSKSLSLGRYLIYAFFWFGMDPGSFRVRREGLSWKRDLMIGLLCMLVGTLGAWLVWAMEWKNIILMFVPMSLGFHFGALRVLKSGLRLAGFPVRTLFPNVLEAQGIGDFWSRRWNTGYSQMMQRNVGRPVGALLGKNAGVLSVFLASGVLHELAITLPVRSGFGLPTLYFFVHGLLVVAEGEWGRSIGKVAALLLVMAPLGILFPPDFQHEVIAECLRVFDVVKSWITQPPEALGR